MSPFWFMLFFLLFFFLSLMGEDWLGSLPERGAAAPSRASDIQQEERCDADLWMQVQSIRSFALTYRHFALWWTARTGSAEDPAQFRGARPKQRAWPDTPEGLMGRQERSNRYVILQLR